MNWDGIAKACPDGVLVVDRSGRITWVNDATRHMFGWPGNALIGQHVNILLPRDLRRCHSMFLRTRCGSLRGPVNMSRWRLVKARRRDGKQFPVRVWLVGETDHGQQRIIAFVRDMSELAARKAEVADAQTALAEKAEQNALLALVAEHITDCVIITDAEGRTIWVNEAQERLSGYSAEEFRGRKPGDLLQGPDTDRTEVNRISQAIREGTDIRCTLLNYSKSGECYWTDLNICPVRDAQGRVEKFIAVQRDVTADCQQKVALETARRAAERAESRLASAIEAISEGFVIYDEYDRLVMANSAYKRMRAEDSDIIVPGVTFEELVRTAVERGHFDTEGEDPETWVQRQVTARRSATNVETIVRFTDGRWMLRRERRTSQGEMIGIRSDITTFKQQEAALKEARVRAEAADRAKSEFVANISHELRTPINGIMGFIQLMLMDDLSAKQRERAEIVKSSSEHLLQLVNDLLDLSRIASNSIDLSPETFDLSELAVETMGLLKPLADQKGLDLHTEIALSAGTTIKADRARVRQILFNLIGNAINYTGEGGVTLTVREASDGVVFEITDTGPGIPAEKLDEIFERFARVGSGGVPSGGVGLGLAITKGLVALMDGKIEVRSAPGAGSTFEVRLPLAIGAPDPKTNPSGEANGGVRSTPTDYEVLVAEDHPVNQRLIRDMLDAIQCHVTLAENGREALEQIEAHDFDLIIMDNQMPEMTGLEAISRIRARGDWKRRIPIIALTANAMRGAETDYEAQGVEAFLTKPLEVDEVVETIRRLGRAGRQIRKSAGAANG